MKDIQTFTQTKNFVKYSLKYIKGKVLDLGAGSAKYKQIIKEKSTKYLAFDMIPGENIDIVGDVLNLPFVNENFDTVISTQVLEHISKPWLMVNEIQRVLKTGGFCILTAPFLIPYHADPHDYFRYTIEGIESLFKDAGFEICESGGYGKTFSVIAEFIRFSWFNPYQKMKKGSWKITHFITKLAGLLDKFSKNKIIYSNVYLIARKK